MKFTQLHPYLTLTLVFLCVKLCHFTILYLTPSTFDLSTNIHVPYICSNENISKVLNKLRHWDAVYFVNLFEKGPRYEHEWVFSPFWWRLINLIPNHKFLNSIIITNLSQLLSSFMLFKLTSLKFIDNDNRIALKSSILFLINSIGIFGTAPYSENFNTLMIFTGLYLIEFSPYYLLSVVFFEIGFWTRSNTILLGIIYLVDFIKKRSLVPLVSGILFGIGIFYYNYLPYKEFCYSDSKPVWCDNLIPSLFSYSQAKYWNNGFLKYWTLNNLPNFLISIPEIYILVKSGLYFKNFKNLQNLVIINFSYLFIIIFFLNIQIVLRISTFMPLQFWYLSFLIEKNEGKLLITWMIVWNLLQCSLFAAFLPPA